MANMESSTRHIEWLSPAHWREMGSLKNRTGEAADLGKTGKHAIVMTKAGVRTVLLIQAGSPN